MEKRTKIEMIDLIIKELTDKEQIAFLENEKALIKKKNAKRTPSANQKENVSIKETILNALSTNDIMSIKEIQAKDSTLASLSNQRISALLKQLIEDNKVERVVEKRSSFFKKLA